MPDYLRTVRDRSAALRRPARPGNIGRAAKPLGISNVIEGRDRCERACSIHLLTDGIVASGELHG